MTIRAAMIGALVLLCAFQPAAQASDAVDAAQDGSADGRKIPILISDHHADHALWLLRHVGHEDTDIVVLDAHADTETNPGRETIRSLLAAGDYEGADSLFGNHNWIHPLVPGPVSSLVWISRIAGFPGGERARGFLYSTRSWGIQTGYINTEELETFPGGERPLPAGDRALFVSIDLDFFYNEDYTPGDISRVFERLWNYSLERNGKVLWAICLSRAWLPGDEYAWELLEQSLRWLLAQSAFETPEVSVFTSSRRDTSRKAQSFRAEGMEPPGFYLRDDAAPPVIRELLEALAK
ncbi:MAG: hypothetical protein LBI86_04700 [Treponema sp.]|nr:hypothetical protein [Treponema sp.]